MLNYKNVCISSFDKKKTDAIVKATTEYYSITFDEMLNTTDRDKITVQQICYYLINVNTNLNPKHLSVMFDKSKTAIRHGLEKISRFNVLYYDTTSNLKKIIEQANLNVGLELKIQ